MILTINPKTYRSLLVDAMPKVIETEADYQHALQEFEKLHVNRNQTLTDNLLLQLDKLEFDFEAVCTKDPKYWEGIR